MQESDVYDVIGEDGFRRLAAAFYRQVPQDDLLGPMYPAEDLGGAQTRLCNFLIFRFGGPQTYIENRGHPRLRMRHAPFKLDQSARNRWTLLMGRAIDETMLPEEAVRVMKPFFEQVATFLLNQ